jgi:hypothetical protein
MLKGIKYHHMGIPTKEKRAGAVFDEKYKLWLVTSDKSPYGVEWLRFEKDCPFPEIIKTVPHVGFEVENMDKAIAGKKVLVGPVDLNDTLKIAFIEDNGSPIEFLQFKNKKNS